MKQLALPRDAWFPYLYPKDLPPSRVDEVVAGALGGIVGRRGAKDLCDRGLVRLGTRPVRAGHRLSPGQQLFIGVLPSWCSPGKDRLDALGPESDSAVGTVYRDTSFAVVSKPRACHSILLHPDDGLTVADCVAACFPESVLASPRPSDSGLVQRLDYYTNGLMVAALRSEVWEAFKVIKEKGKLTKRYLALVEGIAGPTSGTVAAAIDENSNRSTVKVCEGTSHTIQYDTLYSDEGTRNFSVVEVTATQGKRHQVRALLASIGHPLVGDVDYGSRRQLRDLGLGVEEGFLLTAYFVSFPHPDWGTQCEFKKIGPEWAPFVPGS